MGRQPSHHEQPKSSELPPGHLSSPDQPPESPEDYGELVRLYGEAMLRLGQLEEQVRRLTIQLSGHTETGLGTSSSQQQRTEGTAAPAATDQQAADRGIPQPQVSREDELHDLRLRITSMANQLSLAEDQLEETTVTEDRHNRRRRRHRSWWQKLAGRPHPSGSEAE